MKNIPSSTKKKAAGDLPEHPDQDGKVPLLTPEGQTVHKEERNEETPEAEEQETTPKQPLYEDKTEAYYLKKNQKK